MMVIDAINYFIKFITLEWKMIFCGFDKEDSSEDGGSTVQY
jgi:hypothetical protein